MSDQGSITLTIDGQHVSCPPGSTVLQAADSAGIDIPRLCAWPTIKPLGGCRLCLVEVEGLRGYPAACTQPAAAGAVVRTQSAALTRLRRSTLALLLSKHPTGCLLCLHDDDCIHHHGCHSRRSGAVTGCRFCPNDQQCELQKLVDALGVDSLPFPVQYRGLPVDRRNPFIDFDPNLCVLCGRCARVCDEVRGAAAIALVDRGEHTVVSTAGDQPWAATTCQFCGACVDACPTGSLSERVNKWVGVADAGGQTTCAFCPLGCGLELRSREGQLIGSRALVPEQICSQGRFAPVETVLPQGRVLQPRINRDGRSVEVDWETALAHAVEGLREAGSVALYASRDLTSESLHAVVELGRRVFSSEQVLSDADWPAGLDPARIATWDELAAADVVLSVSTALRYSHTPVLLAMRAATDRGASLVTIEPFGHDAATRAAVDVRPLPGDEGAVLRAITARLGAPDDTAEGAIAGLLDTDRGKVIVCGSGLLHAAGEPLAAVLALAEATGARLLPLLAGANPRGVHQILGATTPPVWGEHQPDALVSFGRPPGAERPGAGFWVCWAYADDPLLQQADVVLPATVFAEEGGSFVDVYGRTRDVPRVLAPPAEARSAQWVCDQLAARLDTRPQPAATVPTVRATTAAPLVESLLVWRDASAFSYLGEPTSRRVPGLRPLAAERLLRLNPRDAAEHGLHEGGRVRIVGAGGAYEARVRLALDLPPGLARLAVPPTDEVLPGGAPLAAILGPNPSPVRLEPVAPAGA